MEEVQKSRESDKELESLQETGYMGIYKSYEKYCSIFQEK